MIDLVEGVSIWGVPGLEVDSFVHEVRTFDRHLPACGKVDQSEAILICTLRQDVLAYRWLMYSFPANFSVIPLQSAAPLGSDAVCSLSSGDQTLLFPSPSLAASIWDPPEGWLPLTSPKNLVLPLDATRRLKVEV
jgi:hypothetical protein